MHLSKKDVLLMAFCTGLIVANIYYIQPLIVLISKEFNIPENVAGSATWLTQAGYAVGLFLLVPLGDMFERKKQILVTTAISILALIGVALSPTFYILQICCFLVGAGSIVPQLILPLSATLSEPSQRGKVIGSVMSGLLIGILLSRTLSGAIGKWLGWRSMFWIAAALCTALLGLMYKRFPASKSAFSGKYHHLMRSLFTLIKTQPLLRESTAINMCCFAVFGAFWTTMVLLFSNEPFHFTSEKIGLFGLAGAAGAMAAPLVGKLGDKGSPRKTVGIGIFILTISLILLYLTRENVIGFVIGIILIDVGQQSVHVSNQTRVYALIPEARNRLNTVFMSMSFIGTACGSAIGLFLWKLYGWAGVCAGCLLLMGISMVVYYTSGKRHKTFHAKNAEKQRRGVERPA
ncbi:MFS transporter [Danxiaibacter flavus]|uniref:MFS transporter n=1 Tax=Danxiaibacter flavus TaxID=3049108 RepID=A0ABV3ZCS4_9BACT|nr:MFS transporter [Chitinophagaceae bacterium DXS]